MDTFKDLAGRKRLPTKKDKHLHSAAHVLADELATRLRDPKHFGFYLKLATTYHPDVLRKICGDVLESNNVKNPGKLFAYLIKQHNQERKSNDTSNRKTASTSTPN